MPFKLDIYTVISYVDTNTRVCIHMILSNVLFRSQTVIRLLLGGLNCECPVSSKHIFMYQEKSHNCISNFLV